MVRFGALVTFGVFVGQAAAFILIETAAELELGIDDIRKLGLPPSDLLGLMRPADHKLPDVSVRKTVYPSTLSRQDQAKSLFESIDAQKLHDTMHRLTSYHNRHFETEDGIAASSWIHDAIESLGGGFAIETVSHEWPQNSIDVTVSRGDRDAKDNKLVVVGAHLDSINIEGGKDRAQTNKAPGADDNASSVAVLLEALRILAIDESIKSFSNEVHFHFYAAEEVGLLGSRDVFARYRNDGKDVVAMLNQDMSGRKFLDGGWLEGGSRDTFTVLTDGIYKPLADFLKSIIKQHTNLVIKEEACGYACSDHASATRNGYPSALVAHGGLGTNATWIHTVDDSLEEIDYEHMVEHVKLVLAYVLELGFASID